MQVTLKAGATLDMLTQHEMRQTLKEISADWMRQASEGPRHILWSGQGTVDGGGLLSMGGTSADAEASGKWGPPLNMIWVVKRWNVQNLEAGKTVSAWINNASPNRSIMDGITGFNVLTSDCVVLTSAMRLLFTGSTMAASRVITVSGSAFELPASMMYRLL